MTASGVNRPQVKHVAFPFRRRSDILIGVRRPLGFTNKDRIVSTQAWALTHVLKIRSGNQYVVKGGSSRDANCLNALMGSASKPSVRCELVGSFEKKNILTEPDDGILPVIILLNWRTFPFIRIISIVDEPFAPSKLNGRKTSNRAIAKGFVVIYPSNGIDDDIIIVTLG